MFRGNDRAAALQTPGVWAGGLSTSCGPALHQYLVPQMDGVGAACSEKAMLKTDWRRWLSERSQSGLYVLVITTT